MSRHQSSAIEQLFGLLFAGGVFCCSLLAGIWKLYTRRPFVDVDDQQRNDQQ